MITALTALLVLISLGLVVTSLKTAQMFKKVQSLLSLLQLVYNLYV
jgi:hypothetical protein